MKLNDAQITSKCVEISKCLVDVTTGMIEFDLCDTRNIGEVARLSVAVRRHPRPIDRQTLAAVASALKMDFRIVETSYVSLMEDLGWVGVEREAGRMLTLVDKIPPAADILSVLGKTWKEKQPTQLDEATINSLAELSKRPYSRSALQSELGIRDEEFANMLDYGEAAGYLGRFTSEQEEVEGVWSPLYWQANADNTMAFIRKQNDERFQIIGSLSEQLKKYPGMPSEKMAGPHEVLVGAGIHYGFFPSVGIKDRKHIDHQYIFAPSPQFHTDPNNDIYEKARLIVSCIRHGEHHAEVSRILYPRLILRSMRNNTMNPHPYAAVQYAVLVLHGIVSLEPAETRYGQAYKVLWIDTPENNLAADMADKLLLGGEPMAVGQEELDAQKVLLQGMYSYSSELRKLRTGKEVKAKKEYTRLLELVSGVKL